jgi:aminoglycoside 6'-N-acetyltransferase
MTAYTYRAMSRDDLPMIERWLVAPEVMRWWGEPDEQYELVSGDLDHPDMDQFIVEFDGRPFAYIQCYRLSTWNPGFGEQPRDACGIDQFIGEPEMIGRGHGSKFIRQFVDGLLQKGMSRVLTDPDPTNERAIRAYEKAGFTKVGVVETPDGPSLLMVRP